MSHTDPPAPRTGRPRSTAADAAILEATRASLVDLGWSKLTMGDVATRAGVAKTTLYRRWAGKNELVVDAVAVLFDELELPDRGSLAADVQGVVLQFATLLERPETRTALMAVVAESTRDDSAAPPGPSAVLDRQKRRSRWPGTRPGPRRAAVRPRVDRRPQRGPDLRRDSRSHGHRTQAQRRADETPSGRAPSPRRCSAVGGHTGRPVLPGAARLTAVFPGPRACGPGNVAHLRTPAAPCTCPTPRAAPRRSRRAWPRPVPRPASARSCSSRPGRRRASRPGRPSPSRSHVRPCAR
ncbi:hypothetical protein SMICM304S_01786 [Streptomyces microflavus]